VGAPGAQLIDQAGLADARLAGHQHELCPPAGGGMPQLGQAGPLGGASDQGRTGERAGPSRLPRRRGGAVVRRQQRLVGPPRRRRRLDAQLALEGGRARVVGPQRPRAVAAGVVQPHQHPVGRLVQGVVPQQPLGVGDRLGLVAALLEQRGEALQGVEVAAVEPLALGEQPLVVAALQQLAAVEVGGLPPGGQLGVAARRLRPGDRLLEGVDVQPGGGVGPPPQGPRGHLQEPVGLAQGAPQVVEQVAQVGQGLRLGGVGPQQERQPLPPLRRVLVEQQVGQQRLRPRGPQRRQGGPAMTELEPAEQADAQRGRPGGAAGSRAHEGLRAVRLA
jgi:hypothetical protein